MWNKQFGEHRRSATAHLVGASRIHAPKRLPGEVRAALAQTARHQANRRRDQATAELRRQGEVQRHSSRRMLVGRNALRSVHYSSLNNFVPHFSSLFLIQSFSQGSWLTCFFFIR